MTDESQKDFAQSLKARRKLLKLKRDFKSFGEKKAKIVPFQTEE